MNVWERGAGLTKACGTGACATAVASAKKNLTERLVNIHFQTGKLSIDWKENNRIHMSGPVSNIQELILVSKNGILKKFKRRVV